MPDIKKDSLLLAVLFVIFYNLSFYPFNLFFLAPISFFILLLFIEKCQSKVFAKSILLFYPFYAFHTFWILHLKTDPGIEKYLIIGLILLPAYLSIYTALFVMFTKKILNIKKGTLLLIPSLWVILEYIKSTGPLGFPWMNLYYSQLENRTIVALASWGGPYFLSFLIVLTGYLLFRIFKRPDKTHIYSTGIFLFALLAFGNIAKEQLKNLPHNSSIKIAVLQPNILPTNIYDPKEWLKTKDSLLFLAQKIKDDSVELIVLSESAIPGYFRYSFRAHKLLGEISRITGADILFGTQDKRKKDGKYRVFNTAMLIHKGRIIDQYDKHHLVPFGEWLPYQYKLPAPLREINLGWGDFYPGDIKPVEINSHKIGILICFESIFPEISRKLTKMGAEMLFVITNDGWFGKSKGPLEHFQMSRLRAVETGRYLVRSAKTGVSAVISPEGKVLEKLPLFTKGFFVYRVPFIRKKTIYTRIGNVIVLLSFLIVLVFLVYNNPYTIKERRHN